MEELLARIRAALRHQLQVQGERPIFKIGRLCRSIWCAASSRFGGEEVKLSPKEYELLRIMVQHAGKVLTHKFLLNELWSTPHRPAISPRLCAAAQRQDRARPGAASVHFDRDRHRLSAEGAGLKSPASTNPRMQAGASMKISDFLSPAHVMLDVRRATRAACLSSSQRRLRPKPAWPRTRSRRRSPSARSLARPASATAWHFPTRDSKPQDAIRPFRSPPPRHRLRRHRRRASRYRRSCCCFRKRAMAPRAMHSPVSPGRSGTQKRYGRSAARPTAKRSSAS